MNAIRFSPLLRLAAVLLCAAMIAAGLYVLEDRAKVVWDLTPDTLTELSEGTLQTLNHLEERVHLHLVFKAETESALRWMLETLASSYERTGHAAVDVIDPVTEPGRIRGYAESGRSIAEGSVIVTNEDESRFVVIPAGELYAYQMGMDGSYAITGLSAEQKMTGAIRTVTGGERRQVWFLTGHDEAGMDACTLLQSRLADENYGVGETTLLSGEAQPGDILLMLSPARDLTQEEADGLWRFLMSGGRLLLACDASLVLAQMPRIADVARRVSLSFEDGIVVEDERQTGYWMNSPLYLMPAINHAGGPARHPARCARHFRPGDSAVRLQL